MRRCRPSTGGSSPRQAALRRLATLVARGGRTVGGIRRGDQGNVSVRARGGAPACGATSRATKLRWWRQAYHPAAEPVKWPVGARTPTAGNTLAIDGAAHRRPRSDGQLRERGRGPREPRACGGHPPLAVGVPVIVDGRVWGLAAVGFGTTRRHAGRHRSPPSAASPDSSQVSWWPDTARNRSGSSWVMQLSVPLLIDFVAPGANR